MRTPTRSRMIPIPLGDGDYEWASEEELAHEWGEEADPIAGRHPNSTRFHKLLVQVGALHDQKQRDYGRGDDPFYNVRASAEWDVEPWVGAMIRLNDKVKRLQSLYRTGELRNESAFDSLQDIAVYTIMAYVLLEEEQE